MSDTEKSFGINLMVLYHKGGLLSMLFEKKEQSAKA